MPGSISKTQPTIFTNVDATANSCRFEETRNFLLWICFVVMSQIPLQKSVQPVKIMFLFHLKVWVKLVQRHRFIHQNSGLEPHSSFSKSDLENDLDFYVASRSRYEHYS
uniref:Uncharacterized protein n=1 Tax=Glycine max TaxID=3847 RepID=K7LR57_SOYBN